jgi:hypothetical protein
MSNETPIPAPAAPAVETTQPSPQQPDPKLLQYAKKEKELRRMRAEIDAEKSQWQQREQDYKTNYVPRSRLTEDPMGVLSEAGVTYDKLTELVLQQPNQNDPSIRALKAEIEQLKSKYQENERKQDEFKTTQYQQAITQIGTEVKLLVDGNADYESIKESDSYDAVTALIEQTYQDEGYLMDVEAAAKEVEEYLVEQAFKMSQMRKVKERNKPADTPQAPASADNKQSQMKTLTNQMQKPSSRKLTWEEKRARAIAIGEGKLPNT